jgi:hypothetical protein
MWEFLAASGIGALVVERAFDWFKRKRNARTEEILTYARMAFRQAVEQIRDPHDKTLVYALFDRLIHTGLAAAGLELDERTENKINETFAQLWQIWASEHAANELQEIVGKSKMGDFLNEMMRQATKGAH